MLVELIPVIEITSFDNDIPIPAGPYCDYPQAWDEYSAACLIEAGLPDKLIPYSAGSSFFDYMISVMLRR